MQHYYRTKDKQ